MTPERTKILWSAMREAGDQLLGKLPPSSRHPAGRNPYAHVALCVKNHFGASYRDLPDEQFDSVILYLEHLVANPS